MTKNVKGRKKGRRGRQVMIYLPDVLTHQIDDMCVVGGRYLGRSDFVRDAVRDKLDREKAIWRKQED